MQNVLMTGKILVEDTILQDLGEITPSSLKIHAYKHHSQKEVKIVILCSYTDTPKYTDTPGFT